MRDVERYQQLLGLVAPWTVGRVELSVEGERADICAQHAPEQFGAVIRNEIDKWGRIVKEAGIQPE